MCWLNEGNNSKVIISRDIIFNEQEMLNPKTYIKEETQSANNGQEEKYQSKVELDPTLIKHETQEFEIKDPNDQSDLSQYQLARDRK